MVASGMAGDRGDAGAAPVKDTLPGMPDVARLSASLGRAARATTWAAHAAQCVGWLLSTRRAQTSGSVAT